MLNLSLGMLHLLRENTCPTKSNTLHGGGDSPRKGNAQGQIGKTEFKIDLRRSEGRKLNFSLVSLKKGQTLEKVLLFLELIFLVNGMDNPTSNLT
jgi:hypothetical protein